MVAHVNIPKSSGLYIEHKVITVDGKTHFTLAVHLRLAM